MFNTDFFRTTYRLCSIAIISLTVFLSACSDEHILLGFSGSLDGKFSDLSIMARNGAKMAVEEINIAGGIDGRKIELIVENDHATNKGVLAADRKLIDSGVKAIIGHMTSSATLTALSEFKDIVYISPTTSTDSLEGIKDNFFRVIPSLSSTSKFLASFAYDDLKVRKVAALCDISNSAYGESYKNTFINQFTADGGNFIGAVEYSTVKGKTLDWDSIMDKIKSLNPDSVVAIISARDLAAFAQLCVHEKVEWVIMSSMWGYTNELVQIGGNSVEGIYFSIHVARDCPEQSYKDFRKKFEKRFGWTPNFAALFGYESVHVFAEAVKKNNGRAENLAEVIPGMTFNIVNGKFRINEYGDAEREGRIATVKHGCFAIVPKTVRGAYE